MYVVFAIAVVDARIARAAKLNLAAVAPKAGRSWAAVLACGLAVEAAERSVETLRRGRALRRRRRLVPTKGHLCWNRRPQRER